MKATKEGKEIMNIFIFIAPWLHARLVFHFKFFYYFIYWRLVLPEGQEIIRSILCIKQLVSFGIATLPLNMLVGARPLFVHDIRDI